MRLLSLVCTSVLLLQGCGALPQSHTSDAAVLDKVVIDHLFDMLGHVAIITSTAYSPDGAKILSSDAKGKLFGWDASTGERLWSVEEPDVIFNKIAFSDDGGWAAVAGKGFLGLVDPADGRWIKRFEQPADRINNTVTVSHDGRKLAVGSSDSMIRILDVGSGLETEIAGHEWAVTDLQFTPDHQSLLAGDATSIRLWDVQTGTERRRIVDTTAGDIPGVYWMSTLAFTPEGGHIIAGSANDAVLFKLATRSVVQRFVGHEKEVVEARVTPDLKNVVTASRDHTVLMWNVDTGAVEATAMALELSLTSSMSIAPKGDRFVTGASEFDIFGGFIRTKMASWAIKRQQQ